MVVLTLTLVSDETGVIAVAKVQPTDPVNILQASILNALQIPAHSQDLKHNGVSLNWNTTISASGLADGDLIVVHRRVQPRAPTAPTTQQSATPRNALLEGIRANPTLMEQLRIQNPSLHQRVLNDDSSALMELMPFMRASGGQPRQRQPQQRRPPQQPARSTFDPMSADGQKAIEERIKQENIMNNMEAAWEHNPESFGRMPRLLIKCTVNGVRGVPALVDTGAQMTIISKPCAERCSILHLMDTRFASMAHGVGSAPIRGRIHLALVTLGEEKKETFGMTYSVMDTIGGDFDMILGLDMLRKHRAKIDLDEYCMHIGTIAVPFMDENLEALDAGIDGKKDAGGKEGSGKADGVPATGSEAVSGSGSGSGNREGGSAGGRGNLGGIQNLLELGFSQAEAEEALRACNGNTDQAATMLASRKYGF